MLAWKEELRMGVRDQTPLLFTQAPPGGSLQEAWLTEHRSTQSGARSLSKISPATRETPLCGLDSDGLFEWDVCRWIAEGDALSGLGANGSMGCIGLRNREKLAP